MASSTIQEGDQVIFKRDGLTKVFQIRKNRMVYFEKSKFNVDDIIGEPYGSTFEIDKGKLKKFESSRITQLRNAISAIPEADNRNLLDSENNQKMSTEDIRKMKSDGVTGEKIIEELIENSETFKNKTEFSQAKYLKKKKNKHIQILTILRPTPRLVLEIFSKEPAKICNLRADSLSQLLNYSNVMYGSHVAVLETCQGLVLASVLQRMGGHGKLIQLVPNLHNSVCTQVMDYFSFPKEHLDNVYTFPLNKLSSLSDSTPDTVPQNLNLESTSKAATVSENLNSEDTSKTTVVPENIKSEDISKTAAVRDNLTSEGTSETAILPCGSEEAATNSEDMEIVDELVTVKDVSEIQQPSTNVTEESLNIKEEVAGAVGDAGSVMDISEISQTDGTSGSKRPLASDRDLQRQQKLQKQREAEDIIRSKKLDSLILACKYNPTPILMKLLEFVPPSRPVVVYSQYLEPLTECYTQIKKLGLGLQLKVSETWFREYQVLPQRTHPVMNMSGTGGYLLTFMTIQADKDKPS